MARIQCRPHNGTQPVIILTRAIVPSLQNEMPDNDEVYQVVSHLGQNHSQRCVDKEVYNQLLATDG